MSLVQQGRIDKDLIGGLAFAAFGAFTLWTGRDSALGTLTQMGPGYFPALMAWLCIGLSALVIARALLRNRAAATTPPGAAPEDGAAPALRLDLRAFAFVLLGLIAFALLLERAGLVLATLALVLLVSYARAGTRILRAGLLAIGLAAAATLLFVVALDLPLRVWPI